MAIKKASVAKKYAAYEAILKRRIAELQERVARARAEIQAENDPDDEGALAYRNTNREMLMTNIERDVQSILEMERALDRIKTGRYGICVSCDEPIAEARLKALPWARICIACATNPNQNRRLTGLEKLSPAR